MISKTIPTSGPILQMDRTIRNCWRRFERKFRLRLWVSDWPEGCMGAIQVRRTNGRELGLRVFASSFALIILPAIILPLIIPSDAARESTIDTVDNQCDRR